MTWYEKEFNKLLSTFKNKCKIGIVSNSEINDKEKLIHLLDGIKQITVIDDKGNKSILSNEKI